MAKVQITDQDANQEVTKSPTSSNPPTNSGSSKRARRPNWLLIIVAIAVVGFIYKTQTDSQRLKQELNVLSATQPSAQSEVDKYQEEIGRIVELPKDRTPSLIPVEDPESLSTDNAFFKNAKRGDVVLLYVLEDNSVTAVLYRPSTQKVVEVTSSASVGSSEAKATQE